MSGPQPATSCDIAGWGPLILVVVEINVVCAAEIFLDFTPLIELFHFAVGLAFFHCLIAFVDLDFGDEFLDVDLDRNVADIVITPYRIDFERIIQRLLGLEHVFVLVFYLGRRRFVFGFTIHGRMYTANKNYPQDTKPQFLTIE